MIQEMCCPDCDGLGVIHFWDMDPQNEWDEPCRRCWTLGVIEYIQSGLEHE